MVYSVSDRFSQSSFVDYQIDFEVPAGIVDALALFTRIANRHFAGRMSA
jgi:hypothetical protein